MSLAIENAKIAYKNKEIPVGAVIIDKNNNVIASAYNKMEQTQTVLSHAELIAIKIASKKLFSWRLDNCSLYTTLEPCPMCAGAIKNSRIKKLVFGAFSGNNGAVGSVIDILRDYSFGYKKIEVIGGFMQEQCKKLLTNFDF
jgi:tRNA(adenine34) deaminase